MGPLWDPYEETLLPSLKTTVSLNIIRGEGKNIAAYNGHCFETVSTKPILVVRSNRYEDFGWSEATQQLV